MNTYIIKYKEIPLQSVAGEQLGILVSKLSLVHTYIHNDITTRSHKMDLESLGSIYL